jgi:protein TonB
MIVALALALAVQAAAVPPEGATSVTGASTDPAVQRARARFNLASYVHAEDYPSSALKRGEEATVRFTLDIGADGRVTGCRVTQASGSSALDSATCRIMVSRARFTPAVDARGLPVPDSMSSSLTWRIRRPPQPPSS